MLAFCITFFAANKRRPEIVLFSLFAIFFTLGIWTHPLIMFVAVYLWFFYWMRNEEWPFTKKQSVFYSIILLLIVLLKFNKSLHHGYDSGKMEMVTNIKLQSILHLYTSPQFRFFTSNCITHYWLFTLLFIVGMAALIKARKYLQFAWTFVFVAGYCVVVSITYWDLNSLRFYIESEYMPLSIIATAPFVYYVLPRLPKRSVTYLLLVIFLIRLIYIGNSFPIFNKRMKFNQDIVNKMREKGYYKIIIPNSNPIINSTLMLTWGGPTESMIISSLQNDKPARTFALINPNDIAQNSNVGKNTFIDCFSKDPYSYLNPYYFRIDTTGDYKVVEYAELMK